ARFVTLSQTFVRCCQTVHFATLAYEPSQPRIDGIFEIVRVVGRNLGSITEVHAIVARAYLAQSEPEVPRDRFGFLERHEYSNGQFCGPLRGVSACRSRLTRASYRSSS